MQNNITSVDIKSLDTIVDRILQQEEKLVYCAGASASGKSFIAEQLVEQLEKKGKKTLLISSDSYYSNESQMKYLLYGTFDHPKLIDYDTLESDIRKYFTNGVFELPVYSFMEKRTTQYITIDQAYDIVIVE